MSDVYYVRVYQHSDFGVRLLACGGAVGILASHVG